MLHRLHHLGVLHCQLLKSTSLQQSPVQLAQARLHHRLQLLQPVHLGNHLRGLAGAQQGTGVQHIHPGKAERHPQHLCLLHPGFIQRVVHDSLKATLRIACGLSMSNQI